MNLDPTTRALLEAAKTPCDVCRIEFPHAEPNVAIVDAKLRGTPTWVNLCQGHLGHGEG